jgi:Cu(I)/Ag(I) efflux system protein CusF
MRPRKGVPASMLSKRTSGFRKGSSIFPLYGGEHGDRAIKWMNLTRILALAAFCLAATAHAQPPTPSAHADHASVIVASPAVDQEWAQGTVRKIDKAQRKITLKHGPLVRLDMPAMAMVFKADASVQLDALTSGMDVRFTADMVEGALTVTAL